MLPSDWPSWSIVVASTAEKGCLSPSGLQAPRGAASQMRPGDQDAPRREQRNVRIIVPCSVPCVCIGKVAGASIGCSRLLWRHFEHLRREDSPMQVGLESRRHLVFSQRRSLGQASAAACGGAAAAAFSCCCQLRR